MAPPTRRSGQPPRTYRRTTEFRATGTRRRRLVERRGQDPGPRSAWAFIVVVLVLGVGSIAWIGSGGLDLGVALGPRPTPTPGTSGPAARPVPSPTDALALTGPGPAGPATPRAAATPRAEATPGPAATSRTLPDPTAPPGTPIDGSGSLRVDFPQDGDTVVSRRINVFGRAPAGARVVLERPGGSTVTAVARDDGLWVMGVDLDPGENQLRLRLDGSEAGAVVVRVTFQRN